MFTLIKREIEDNIIAFISQVIVCCVTITIIISISTSQFRKERLTLLIPLILIGINMFSYCAIGSIQMQTDKTRKVSCFLATLTVTRMRILLAKVITGILAILLTLIPVTLTTLIVIKRLVPPMTFPVYQNIILKISFIIFLMDFACYCFGLLTGWNQSKILSTFGCITLTGIFIPIIIIKGLGLEIVIILVALIAVSLTYIWLKFISTSL